MIELSAAPILDDAGNILGGVVAAMDVDERVRAEQGLRASEATLSAVLEALPVGVFIADANGAIVRDNAAHRELWHLRRKRPGGRIIATGSGTDLKQAPGFLHRIGLWLGRCSLAKLLKVNWSNSSSSKRSSEGFSLAVQPRFETAKARSFPASLPRWTSPTGCVRKRRFVQAKKQFRTLANAIPQLCWMARPDGNIFWYNQRWYDYTGTRPDEMEGWGWKKVHDPDVLPVVMERWTAALASGEPLDMVFPLRGGDGIFRPFLTRVVPIRDLTGKVTRWFGTNTDISDQKRTEAELRRANSDLEQFAFSASHDLQEPLRNIAIFSQILSRQYGPVAGCKRA